MSEAAQASPLQTSMSEEIAIQMIEVHKWYGEFHVLKDINLTVYEGELVCLRGPSGCGTPVRERPRKPRRCSARIRPAKSRRSRKPRRRSRRTRLPEQ